VRAEASDENAGADLRHDGMCTTCQVPGRSSRAGRPSCGAAASGERAVLVSGRSRRGLEPEGMR
jgi:hypothetical protein